MNQQKNIVYLGQSKVKVPLLKGDNVTQGIFEKVQQSKKFQDWINEFDTTDIEVKSIKVDYVFMFGQNIGFVNLIVDNCTHVHNIKLSGNNQQNDIFNDKFIVYNIGFVFMRGKSVAMLIIINKKFILLVKQFRIPVGQWLLEAPAGMIDESGHFTGVAAKELKEEADIDIEENELIYLGGMYPSPGGCDEQILLYAVEKDLSDEKIKEITNKTHGEENEQITIELKNFNIDEIVNTKDSKLMCAALAYQRMKTKPKL